MRNFGLTTINVSNLWGRTLGAIRKRSRASAPLAIATLVAALLLPGAAPAGTPVTLTFSSGPDWKTFSKDPGPTSFSLGKGFIGFPEAVCLNEDFPWPCPDDAVLYGYPGGGWFADLSPIPAAVWIWAPNVTGDTAPAEFASFFFSNTFILAGYPTNGVIYIAADDFAEVRVNGSVVGTVGSVTDIELAGDAQSRLHEFDISSFLKPGRNVITIQGQNGSPDFAGCDVTCTYSQNPVGVVFGGSLSFAP